MIIFFCVWGRIWTSELIWGQIYSLITLATCILTHMSSDSSPLSVYHLDRWRAYNFIILSHLSYMNIRIKDHTSQAFCWLFLSLPLYCASVIPCNPTQSGRGLYYPLPSKEKAWLSPQNVVNYQVKQRRHLIGTTVSSILWIYDINHIQVKPFFRWAQRWIYLSVRYPSLSCRVCQLVIRLD